MTITIVVEDGTSKTDSNTYVSTATIDSWVETNPHDATWNALTQDQKNGYAVWSARLLDEQTDWDGSQTSATQALDLPRSGMIDKNGNSIDSDEIPTDVQNAQSEFARLLAISDRTADSDMAGFKQIEVGSINLVADKTTIPPVMPDSVWNMINPYGDKAVSSSTSRVIRS